MRIVSVPFSGVAKEYMRKKKGGVVPSVFSCFDCGYTEANEPCPNECPKCQGKDFEFRCFNPAQNSDEVLKLFSRKAPKDDV